VIDHDEQMMPLRVAGQTPLCSNARGSGGFS
jgi:hypothetical protein